MNKNESPEKRIRMLCDKYGITYGKWMDKYFLIGRLRSERERKTENVESIDSFEVAKFIQLLVEAKKIEVHGDKDYSVVINQPLAERLWLFLNTLLEEVQDGEYQAFYELNGKYDICSCVEGEPECPKGATKIVEKEKQPCYFNEADFYHPFFLEPYTQEEFARILRYEKYKKLRKVKRESQTENQRLGEWVYKIMADAKKEKIYVPGDEGKGLLISKMNEFANVPPTKKYCFIGDLLFESGLLKKHNRDYWLNLADSEKQREVRDWENSFLKWRNKAK